MKNLANHFPLFWQGAYLSYIALFHWMSPSQYMASKILMPLAQMYFFVYLGTFATGFFLISWMGTRNILLLMALILIVSAPLFGGAFFKKRVLMVLFPVLFVFLWAIHWAAFKKPIDENTYLGCHISQLTLF